MDTFLNTLHVVSVAIGVCGVLVIALGVVKGVISVVTIELASLNNGFMDKRTELRQNLGFYLLLGLEFLVAADIVETLSAPTLEHLAMLGGIVLIRTVISFSLNWELSHREIDQSAC